MSEDFKNIQQVLTPQFSFAAPQEDEEIFHQKDLIQLHPFGMSVNVDNTRPFLLLKDQAHEHTLPVAINALEAGVTLSQANKSVAPLTPHRFTSLLMESLGIVALQCVFIQIKGVHQFVRIYLKGHPHQNSIKLRADEAMSLCLYLGIPIFATKSFIGRSKLMTAEIQGLSQGIQMNPRMMEKTSPYVM